MAKYIDADALRESIVKMMPHYKCGEETPEEMAATDMAVSVIQEIDDMPAADVEPVRHGEWIERPHEIDDTILTFKCSICEHTFFWWCDRCPNCGCKMDGGIE